MTRIAVDQICKTRKLRPMMRASLLMMALLLVGGCADVAPPQGPHVVLVVIDTLRADRLGTYGYPLDTSPNLDALAGEGLVFERAIAASTATAPSHASLMTSRWVRDHSIGYMNGSTQLEGDKTLAEVFQESGYDTAAFIGNAVIRSGIGIDRGFDIYDDELPTRERNRPIFERTAPATTERAIEWLQQRHDRPYFLWVHYQDPHGPYTPPAPWDKDLQAPALEGDQPLRKLKDQSGRGGLPAYQWVEGDRASKRYRSRYAGEIRHFDDWLGRLIKAVESQSEGREIIWAITSDHGESLGEDDYWFAHGHATTPNLSHIPLIVRAPGLAPGRVKGLAHHVDVLPTLLSLAGLPVPAGSRGIDLTTGTKGGGSLPDRVVFSDIGGEASAYSRDGFLRVVDPQTVASAGNGEWSHHRWSRDGVLLPGAGDLGVGWELDPTEKAVAPETKKALEEYLSLVPPLKATAAPDEDQIERLRALGYIDPAG